MPAIQTQPRRLRGFNVKFKSDKQGCYRVYTLAYSAADAMQNALNEFRCGLKMDCVPFSIFVEGGARRG